MPRADRGVNVPSASVPGLRGGLRGRARRAVPWRQRAEGEGRRVPLPNRAGAGREGAGTTFPVTWGLGALAEAARPVGVSTSWIGNGDVFDYVDV